MQIITNELFDKLTQMAQQDEELKKMLIVSNQQTRSREAYATNALRELESELYQKVNTFLANASSEELEDKEQIKNSDEIESIVAGVIPTDNKSLGELMLDFQSIALVVEQSSVDDDLYKAIEVSLYQHLRDFAIKQIEDHEEE